jgi:hypothetical protein
MPLRGFAIPERSLMRHGVCTGRVLRRDCTCGRTRPITPRLGGPKPRHTQTPHLKPGIVWCRMVGSSLYNWDKYNAQ